MLLRSLSIILLFLYTTSLWAALGNLVPGDQIPASVCIAKFVVEGQSYHCSGAMVDSTHFKTAAHCIKDHAKITIHCVNGDRYDVVKVDVHSQFSQKLIKKEIENRKFDHALLEISKEYTGKIIRFGTSKEAILSLINNSRECAFYGAGLNP